MNFRQFITRNTWWGKLLGCFFGYLIAGPIGALFGILIGNFFDRGLTAHLSKLHLLYGKEKQQNVQKIFFEATFTIMGYLAKADGHVSAHEIRMAEQMMKEMSLNQEQKIIAKAYFSSGKKFSYVPNHILTLLYNSCHDNPDLLKLFIDIQYRIAQVDGLSTKKLQAFDAILKQLGFAPLYKQYRFYEDFGYNPSSQHHDKQRYDSFNQNYDTKTPQNALLAQAYALLEIEPTASKVEVKQAYRRSISRNHPDKLIAQGLPEEMIKIANDKTQKITKAYEQICASKGW